MLWGVVELNAMHKLTCFFFAERLDERFLVMRIQIIEDEVDLLGASVARQQEHSVILTLLVVAVDDAQTPG